MHKLLCFLSLCLSVLVVMTSELAHGQSSYLYDTGAPNYSSMSAAEAGAVNVSNGNIHLDLALTDGAERGKLSSSVHLLYDSKLWTIRTTNGVIGWQPLNSLPASALDSTLSTSGWRIQEGSGIRTATADEVSNGCDLHYFNYRFADKNGTVHYFPIVTDHYVQNCGANNTSVATGSAFTTDGSGYQALVTNYTNIIIYDKDGNQVGPAAVDTNGNMESYDSNTGELDDTRGDTVFSRSSVQNDVQTYYVEYLEKYTATYQTINVSTAFAQAGVKEFAGTLYVIKSLQFPDGQMYSFTYDSGTTAGHYGELTSVTLPTGGIVQYGYSLFKDSYGNTNRWLTSKIANGGTTRWTPSVISTCTSNGSATDVGCQEQVVVSMPLGDEAVYIQTLNNGAWNTKISRYTGNHTSGTLLATTSTQNTFTQYQNTPGCVPSAPRSCTYRSSSTTTTTFPLTSQNTKTVTNYVDPVTPAPWYGDTASVAIYDFYTGNASSVPLAQTIYKYKQLGSNNAPYGSHYLSDVYSEDGQGNVSTATHYSYDTTPLTATPSSFPGHQLVGNHGGNLTRVGTGPANDLFTTLFYDDAGSILSIVDPSGNATGNTAQHTTSYGYDPYSHDSLVSSITRPTTGGVSHVSTAAYTNQMPRRVVQTNDENSVAAGSKYPVTYSYYPVTATAQNAGKLQSVTYPDGGLQQFYFTPTVTTQSTLTNAGTGGTLSVDSIVDAYGRLASVGSGGPLYGTTTTTTFDSQGRSLCASTPQTYPAGPTDGKECVSSRDGLDRPLLLTHADGTHISYSYLGNKVTVTDELQHKKAFVYDALGRLSQVWEPDSSGSLNWETDYTYTPEGNITSVIQKGGSASSTSWRKRTWLYDPYGRLAQETTPESGTICFGVLSGGTCTPKYDANGNLLQYTDGNGTVVMSYDELNRITSRTATQAGASPVTQTYIYDRLPSSSEINASADIPAVNLVGHLAASADSTIGIHFYQYDALGRETYKSNCISQPCAASHNPFRTTYDQAGDVLTLQYPDTRTIAYSYDDIGRLNEVDVAAWRGNTAQAYRLWSRPSYYPTGQLMSATIGSNIGVNASFNNRQELVSLAYSSSGSLWQRQYKWDLNAVNLLSVTNPATGVSRNFTYDQVNRLTSATDLQQSTGSPVQGGLAQTYSPDPWGNLTTNSFQPGVFPASNRTPNMSFSGAGSMLSDSVSTYSYDPLGRLRTSAAPSSSGIFSYDADSHRVRTDSTNYALGFFYVGEKVVQRIRNGTRLDYVYAGNQLIAEIPGDQNAVPIFDLVDHLGSIVVSASQTGTALGTADYAPYGQTISSTVSSALNFLSLEAAAETNAHTAEYRDLVNTESRWLTPDPYRGSYDLSDPQSLNRYAYANLRPMSGGDPSGLFTSGSPGGGGDYGGDDGSFGGFFNWLFGTIFGGGGGGHPTYKPTAPRPPDPQDDTTQASGQPDWTDPLSEHIGLPRNAPMLGGGISGLIGLPQPGCEFGACGGSPFSAQDPNNSQSDGIGITFNLGVTAFFTAAFRSVGCTLVGAASAIQSFTGIGNSPPGYNDVLRPINEHYAFAGTLAYKLVGASKTPAGRLVGYTAPRLGLGLVAAQVGLAGIDGATAAYGCAAKPD